MSHFDFRAMGTWIEIWTTESGGESEIRALFDDVERVCSRFLPDSELSAINSSDGARHVLSPTLADVLATARLARERTDGLVDVGIGAAVRAWGYDRDFDDVSDLSTPPGPMSAPSWDVNGTVLIRSPETTIDLGGIAKGWTCDRAVEDGLATVASAGGDLRSCHPDTIVEVLDPAETTTARLMLGVGALATSSVGRRRWLVGDREVSHIMNPRTMSPAMTPIVSATVVADTAAEAETGAKATLLLGEDGLAWADDQDWIRAALVVWHDGSVFATSGMELAA